MQIRFSNYPGPEPCEFIEVEDDNGNSINVGDWVDDGATVLLKFPGWRYVPEFDGPNTSGLQPPADK